jgi:predicted nucleotidyltransferase
MTSLGLTLSELEAICSVLAEHHDITRAMVFGSRANGTHRPNSDIDIALDGNISPLEAESIAGDLEELPLPYRFDVIALRHITNEALLKHIERVGVDLRRQ